MLVAILFDLDSTLANTDPIHFRTWQEFLKTYGLEIDDEFYKSRISGRLNPEIVRDILPQVPLKEGEKVADEKEAYFRRLAGDLQPLAGLTDLLAWTDKSALKRALVTNAPRTNVDFMLDILQLREIFEVVILAEEASAGKPDPAPYKLALERLGISAEKAIAFEDSPSGIRSAVGAGIYTIGVASTHDPIVLKQAGAALTIFDFTDDQLWELLGVSG